MCAFSQTTLNVANVSCLEVFTDWYPSFARFRPHLAGPDAATKFGDNVARIFGNRAALAANITGVPGRRGRTIQIFRKMIR